MTFIAFVLALIMLFADGNTAQENQLFVPLSTGSGTGLNGSFIWIDESVHPLYRYMLCDEANCQERDLPVPAIEYTVKNKDSKIHNVVLYSTTYQGGALAIIFAFQNGCFGDRQAEMSLMSKWCIQYSEDRTSFVAWAEPKTEPIDAIYIELEPTE